MSVFESQQTWRTQGTLGQPTANAGPLGLLPSLTRRQVLLEERLGLGGPKTGPAELLASVAELLVGGIAADGFEMIGRGSGLGRPGVIAQFSWPRLGTQVGLGIEPVLAHAIVDRLLGFERLAAEGRLQVTPVEWGILSFAIARALIRLDSQPGPMGLWDLTIDRVGPDPFDPAGLGPLVTWRWRVRLGMASGMVRLWLPESLLSRWLMDDPAPRDHPPFSVDRFSTISGLWKAEAGRSTLPRGLGRIHPGSILPIDGSPLRGTIKSPEGTIELVLEDRTGRTRFLADPAPGSRAARLILKSSMIREARPRETYSMPIPAPLESSTNASDQAGTVAAAEVPVTLTVELGRINLPLGRLANLKPGDVLELGRHPREPVELTSGDRLIGRGELVQIDTELGVRVTHLYL